MHHLIMLVYRCLYCAGTNLQELVNNNCIAGYMIRQLAIVTKIHLKISLFRCIISHSHLRVPTDF